MALIIAGKTIYAQYLLIVCANDNLMQFYTINNFLKLFLYKLKVYIF